MSIKETLFKVKRYFEWLRGEQFVLGVVIVLVALSSFGLGRLSLIEESRQPVKFLRSSAAGSAALRATAAEGQVGTETPAETVLPTPVADLGGKVVGSKSGRKYHFPWCPGARTISEVNKIWFSSIEAARAAGYVPAVNCKGLK